ncbi:MAG TPA: VCBS repeat-containing protein, partial [Eudoraea sp.]|nr:VCBS repeat-containing protein [Eudoraea sp.]
MKKKSGANIFFCLSLLLLAFGGCKPKDAGTAVDLQEKKPPLFTLLGPEMTNIHFQNKLSEGLNANVLMYEYLYNGGGVAAGDFNGDDLIDLYFTSNMGDNSFYLNQGNMKFREVSAPSGVSGRAGPWKTGITAADVNGDGLLDLYLCYSGALPPEKRKNQLFINMGNDKNNIPVFEEKAGAYGLDSPAFSNQAYFLDYDRDGDLDALLLNHNPKSLPVLNEVSTREFLKKDDPLQGVRLYRQTKGVFEDVTVSAGISGSALTYGLGIGISDLNNDGWVDFYVSNDYAVPDYLYINNGDGTFTNRLNESMGHTSHFSMGNDIADINNDGLQDIITLDMLPEDNRRQKLLLAPDNYEKFDLNLHSGFHYQYMRNMLQLNNGNGTFSEIGQLAGISNTDWSWAALLADYDNDGFKDLFVTNGYYRDYTNLDFINYMDDFVKSRGRLMREDVLDIIQQMPSSNLTNYYFSNKDGVTFSEETKTFGLDQASNSNGAAYADLDNDGDLDLIVNNINKPAYVYRNESGGNNANSLSVELRG